jgi:hypothetical protein
MQTKLWFKRKKYGWGWTPSTWQGWLVIAIYLALVFGIVCSAEVAGVSDYDMLMNFVPRLIILTSALILVSYVKGERPKWMWGDEDTDQK